MSGGSSSVPRNMEIVRSSRLSSRRTTSSSRRFMERGVRKWPFSKEEIQPHSPSSLRESICLTPGILINSSPITSENILNLMLNPMAVLLWISPTQSVLRTVTARFFFRPRIPSLFPAPQLLANCPGAVSLINNVLNLIDSWYPGGHWSVALDFSA